MEYDFKQIEAKWQSIWEKEKYGQAEDFSDKPKFYSLIEFPYPSGSGLHVGHCMMYSAADAHARMMRMKGFNVMFPMGWDAFGLPTENFAIKNKVKPQVVTEQAITAFRKQQKSIGYSFDWPREINTTDPTYYKWTQWIFLQFYKHGIVEGKLVEISDEDTTTPRLAYQAEMPVNWCPSCKIVLANEEVIAGNCERCGTDSEKRKQKQWMLRITSYADRLIKDLDTVDYPKEVKAQQINWIGKSVGSKISFKIKDNSDTIKVFTTRADTLFGCTYVVLSPESPMVKELKSKIENWDEVQKYVNDVKSKSDLERTELEKDKTGVELKGIYAINPINNKEVSVWVADYVLASYGTGAVMAVPAHDDRDFAFAKKYDILIIPTVIKSNDKYRSYLMGAEKIEDSDLNKLNINIIEKLKDGIRKIEIPEESIVGYEGLIVDKLTVGYWNEYVGKKIVFIFKHKNNNIEKLEYNQKNVDRINKLTAEFTGDKSGRTIIEDWLDNSADGFYKDYLLSTDYGILIDSGEFDGLNSKDAQEKITEKLKEKNTGDFTTNFKLRDWIFSRQHYWGEPIPIVHCDKCGTVPVPVNQLPVMLPEIENYEPTDSGKSPLSTIIDWVNTKCPHCDGPGQRETDTMPNWAGSSWYYLRYTDPQNKNELAAPDKLRYWTPVDIYNGGPEHITLHLLYSRFWHKFLYDLKVVETVEPYQKRIQHGIILGPDGQKMSKSKGNVINPDEMVEKFGADTLRAYIMFIGPYDQESAWNMSGIQGVHRFLKRVWLNVQKVKDNKDSNALLVKLNQTIQGVTDDLENFQMNTVISKLMELNNVMEKENVISKHSYEIFLKLLYPACPHIASELWDNLGENDSIDKAIWPKFDKNYLVAEEIEIAVQINGKTRAVIKMPSDTNQVQAEKIAMANDRVKDFLGNNKISKIFYITGRVVNFVVK